MPIYKVFNLHFVRELRFINPHSAFRIPHSPTPIPTMIEAYASQTQSRAEFLVGSHYPRRIVDSVAPRACETASSKSGQARRFNRLAPRKRSPRHRHRIDPELIPDSSRMFSGFENFRLIEADARRSITAT